MNRFLKRNKIEFELKNKVRKYFEIMNNESLANVEKELKLIEKLSKSMKEEILVKGNGHVLKQVPLFHDNFSEITLHKLILKLKRVMYCPEEFIFHV